MKPTIKKLIQYGILALILFLFVNYISKNINDFKQVALINPLWLIPLVAIYLVNYFFLGMQTKNLIEPLGVKLKKIEAFMLAIITGFYNIITPAHGGMAIRAVYLKKKYQFTYTNFLSSLAGMYVITFAIASLIGLISTYFIFLRTQIYSLPITLIFAGLFLPLLTIIIVSPKFKETKSKNINRFIRVINGWNIIRKNKKVVLTCVLVTTTAIFLNSMIQIISFTAVGVTITIYQALFLAAIANIAILIRLTPGNLGVQEAVSVFSAAVLGIGTNEALVAAIILRIVQMISLFTLGPIFSYKLLKNVKNETNT